MQWSFRKKLVQNFIRDLRSLALVICYHRLQNLDELCFDFAREHCAGRIGSTNLLKFFIVIHEKSKISIGNINIHITSKSSMFLNGFSAAREGVFVNFSFDFLGSVIEKNCRLCKRGRHLGVISLKGGEELGMD